MSARRGCFFDFLGGTHLPDKLRVGSLFAGIGGIDLGLERTGGFETAWFSEIDPFANAVLRKHWPDVPNLGDVRNVGEGTPRVDLIAGGFPCQPVSLAGKRLAQDDPRWLWPQVARVVEHLRPHYVLLENVPGLRSKGLGDVLEDLSALGYDAEWEGVPASFVGALHRRDRFWLVAYPADSGSEQLRIESGRLGGASREGAALARVDGASQPLAGSASEQSYGPRIFRQAGWAELADGSGSDGAIREWTPEPAVGRVADGVPGRVAQLRALGNAVVPQVAEIVGRLILEDYYKEVTAGTEVRRAA